MTKGKETKNVSIPPRKPKFGGFNNTQRAIHKGGKKRPT